MLPKHNIYFLGLIIKFSCANAYTKINHQFIITHRFVTGKFTKTDLVEVDDVLQLPKSSNKIRHGKNVAIVKLRVFFLPVMQLVTA
jgi:hypothetical protein